MEYVCLGCGARHPIDELLYTCPSCGGVFLLEDTTFDKLKEHGGAYWRNLFDSRAATRNTDLRGVFRFYELMAPVLEQEDILYTDLCSRQRYSHYNAKTFRKRRCRLLYQN